MNLLDNTSHLLGFKNGVFDFKQKKFYIDFLVRPRVDYKFHRKGTTKSLEQNSDVLNILNVLQRLFLNEDEFKKFIELLLLIASGDKCVQFHIFLGSNLDLKYTILDFIDSLFGDHVFETTKEKFLTRIPTEDDMIQLNKKRVLLVELDEDKNNSLFDSHLSLHLHRWSNGTYEKRFNQKVCGKFIISTKFNPMKYIHISIHSTVFVYHINNEIVLTEDELESFEYGMEYFMTYLLNEWMIINK